MLVVFEHFTDHLRKIMLINRKNTIWVKIIYDIILGLMLDVFPTKYNP